MKGIRRITVNKQKKTRYSWIDCILLEMLGVAEKRSERGKEDQEMGLTYCTAVA
jgi:hypothetical protein